MENEIKHRRTFGVHLTSVSIFNDYIRPKLEGKLNDYIWVDLYCGEGNLILPILNSIPIDQREHFFESRIFLFDIQEKMIEKTIENAVSYGIPRKIAEKNVQVKDTLSESPAVIRENHEKIYHITNPPYLYVGYIAKHKDDYGQLKYFTGANAGLQDLYQLALINDLRNEIGQMVYIIPSNFLFGHSVSKLIRQSFLKYYSITDAVIFEKKIFENTGTNVVICFFQRSNVSNKTLEFEATKINSRSTLRKYRLSEKNGYRAGDKFEEYVEANKKNILKVNYYLTRLEVEENKGKNRVVLLDSKEYTGSKYLSKEFFVNDKLMSKIKSNPLFIRTVDTGGVEGKAGLYSIKEAFNVDGIFVSGNTYRTNPIQVFIEPTLTAEQSKEIQNLFNIVLNELRESTDSEFMTTYKYSENGSYTRKYLGLSQARKILETLEPSNVRRIQQTL
ncbi:MAG: N-6 DNA methylase [Thermoplasmatales archaeon]